MKNCLIAVGLAALQANLLAATTLRIMPVGDSITEGAGGTKAGYRYFLERDLIADGYAVDYVGDIQVNPCDELLDKDHSGHSGWQLGATGAGYASIQDHIGTWLDNLSEKPDFILLHAGTNDAKRGEPLTDLPEALGSILDIIAAKAPNAHVIVTTVLKRTDTGNWTGGYGWDSNIDENFNAKIPEVVAAHGGKVHFLDMRSKLTQPGDFSSDGLHPNDSGYLKMADAWRAKIEKILGPRPWTAADAEAERAVYSLVYEFTPVTEINAANPASIYTTDNSATLAGTAFDRVGYFMELQKTGGDRQTVWVSFDAMTDDLGKIGLPHDYEYNGSVTRMNVYSNVAGVDNLAMIPNGRLEFWSAGFSDGGDGLFDSQDDVNRGLDFGTMQIHDLTTGKTVLSYSAWKNAGFRAALGIGTCPLAQRKNGDPDWSFAENIDEFEVKSIKVYAHLATDPALPELPAAKEDEEGEGEGEGEGEDEEEENLEVESVGLLLLDNNTTYTDVGAGKKLKVDALTTEKNAIVKTGDGVLELGALRGMGNAADYDQQAGLYGLDFQPTAPSVTVWGGSVAIGAPVAIDPSARTTTPVMHFDASAADTLTTEPDGLDTRVTQWRDPVSEMTAEARFEFTFDDGTTQTMPAPYFKANVLNGLPVVDFGKFVQAENGQRPDGQYYALRDYDLTQSGALKYRDTAVREIFMVVRTNERRNQPFYLGSTYGWVYVFSPGNDKGTMGFPQCAELQNGETRIDGVKVRHDQYVPDQEFHVVALSATGPIYNLNTLTMDRHCRIGGMALGEILAYDRELSVEERRAVEDYLMRKWFKKPHPMAGEVALGNVSFAADVAQKFAADRDVTAGIIDAKGGTFTKSGSGTLTAEGVSDAVTGLVVAGGSLAFASAGDPLDVMGEASFHIDPSDDTTLVTDGDNVTRINDVRETVSRYAETSAQSKAKGPTLVKATKTNLDLLDFGTFSYDIANSQPDTCGMLWNQREQVYTVCMVIEKKDVNGHDSFVLGDPNEYHFHGDDGNILNAGYAYYRVKPTQDGMTPDTVWTLNGKEIDPLTTRWPEGPCVITVTIADTRNDGIHLDGPWAGMFAQDRSQPCRIGGMRYGEVIIFNKTISQSKVKAISGYLMERWLGSGKDTSGGFQKLDVAGGSSLSYAGDVTVADGAAINIGYAKNAPGSIAVGGDVLLGKNVTVTIGSAESPAKGKVAILKAATLTGAEEALRTWSLTLNGKTNAKFRYSIEEGPDGVTLSVNCGMPGLMIFIR